jgi:hypothetical protein
VPFDSGLFIRDFGSSQPAKQEVRVSLEGHQELFIFRDIKLALEPLLVGL